jgi:uncharacterized protein VirK/YbjX
LEPASRVLGKNKKWFPAKVACALWHVVCNVDMHPKIIQLLRFPEYVELTRDNPLFVFKALTDGYLARHFSVAERAACFTHHYQRLRRTLPGPLLVRVLHQTTILVNISARAHMFRITFGMSRTHDKEGELSLNFVVDDTTTFILSFTVVPGWVVKSSVAEVLLITRLQGIKGHFPKISLATKALGWVAPPALLVAALQGVGDAFGIRSLGCISGGDQSSYCEECASMFFSAYDEFFIDHGLAKNAANVFLSPIPMVEKPMGHLTDGHKLHTKKRREFKRRIAQAVYRALRDSFEGNELKPHQVSAAR